MIAETLAGIALFKASVEGIKSVIGTANDVKRIQEMRAEQKQIALEKKQKQDEIIEVVMVIGAVILVGAVLIGGVTIWLKLS